MQQLFLNDVFKISHYDFVNKLNVGVLGNLVINDIELVEVSVKKSIF